MQILFLVGLNRLFPSGIVSFGYFLEPLGIAVAREAYFIPSKVKINNQENVTLIVFKHVNMNSFLSHQKLSATGECLTFFWVDMAQRTQSQMALDSSEAKNNK